MDLGFFFGPYSKHNLPSAAVAQAERALPAVVTDSSEESRQDHVGSQEMFEVRRKMGLKGQANCSSSVMLVMSHSVRFREIFADFSCSGT